MKFVTLRVAWRNLGRNRKRTAFTVSAIAIGQLALMLIAALVEGMTDEMMRTVTGPMVGHVQIHDKGWREERAPDRVLPGAGALVSGLRAVPGVTEVSVRVFAPVLAAPGKRTGAPVDGEPGMILGVDVGSETGRGGILDGLEPADRPGPGEVVLGRTLANRLSLEAGSELALIGADADGFPVADMFTVKAVVHAKTEILERAGIVMNLEEARSLLALRDAAHEIVVRGEDRRKAEELADRVASLPSLKEAEVLPWKKAVPELEAMIRMKDVSDIILVAIVFVATIAGVTNTMMMSTFERRRELGMLLAVGARPRRIAGMIVAESVVLGFVGVAVGSLLGIAIVLVTGYTGIPYGSWGGGGEAQEMYYKGVALSFTIFPRLGAGQVLRGVVAVGITAVIASLWPALVASRLEPVEAMRS